MFDKIKSIIKDIEDKANSKGEAGHLLDIYIEGYNKAETMTETEAKIELGKMEYKAKIENNNIYKSIIKNGNEQQFKDIGYIAGLQEKIFLSKYKVK